MAVKVTRPLVRWHGGKFRLAPWILSFFPEHRTYVEPFGGGGSVLLRKSRSYAEVYNDLDGEIVNLFRVARDHGGELCRLVEMTPFAREEFILAFQPAESPLERARRLMMRLHMGHASGACTLASNRQGGPGTGFRAWAPGRGTSPSMDWARLPNAMEAVVERLRGVTIEQRDAFEVLEKMDRHDTLIYADPPYLPETRDDARADYRHELTEADHVRLGQVLHDCQGKVILSGYASDLYASLYADWHRVETPALADGGRPRTEVLWMNFVPAIGAMQFELNGRRPPSPPLSSPEVP